MDQIQYEIKSPVGPLFLVASAEGLQGMYFNKQRVEAVKKLGVSKPEKILSKAVSQVEEYFAGKRQRFDIAFDLSGNGCRWQRRGHPPRHVWGQSPRLRGLQFQTAERRGTRT